MSMSELKTFMGLRRQSYRGFHDLEAARLALQRASRSRRFVLTPRLVTAGNSTCVSIRGERTSRLLLKM
jgi:hypothetical protein